MNTQNKRYVGASVYGLRMPIITEGADIATIISDTLVDAKNTDYQPVQLNNKDIIGITESFLARAQGNFVSLTDIADEVAQKFPSGDVAIAFPILSRNRFVKILEALTKGVSGKVYVCLSYPADEVGNPIMDEEKLYYSDVNPYTDVMTDKEFSEKFGHYNHPITNANYIDMYKAVSDKIEVVLLNNPLDITKLTNQVIVASIHKRHQHKKMLEKQGATVITLTDLCSKPNPDKGWSEYGLLGSNFSDADRLKLFPRNAKDFCIKLQEMIMEKSGKNVEVLVYGDGGFKCPSTHIWELADPVVSPGFTDGLKGMPNEVKIKAVADNNKANPEQAIVDAIANKMKGDDSYALGTTPRQITDLVGSLCDLTTGSGDKGTPVVVIKGYFDDYTTQSPTE